MDSLNDPAPSAADSEFPPPADVASPTPDATKEPAADEEGGGGTLEDDLFGDGDGGDDDGDVAMAAAGSDDGDDDAGKDMFGDEDDGDDAMDGDEKPLTEEEEARRRALEYDEEDREVITETRESLIADATLANLPLPKASDGKHWDFRLPAFLEMQNYPFVATELEEIEEDQNAMLPDENIIRWQYVTGPSGEPIRQSNARIVHWSDGSQSLQVGSELFDLVYNLDQSAAAPTLRASSSAASTSQPTAPTTSSKPQSLTYLFAQHDYARVLEAQAALTGNVTLRPYGLNSATHRVLAARTANKHAASNTRRRTNMITVSVDPERQKLDREAEEMKKAKEAKKALAAERRKAGGPPGGKGIRKRKFNARLFSDEDDLGDEDAEGEEDDDADGGGGAKATSKGKRRNPKRGRDGMFDGSDDGDGFVVPDANSDDSDNEDDDGSDAGAHKKKSKGKNSGVDDGLVPDPEAPLEALEVAEKRLEEEERRRKSGGGDEGEASDGEEEHKVGRRRLVVESDEEDE